MGVILESFPMELLILFVVLLTSFILWVNRKQSYFSSLGVFSPPCTFLLGTAPGTITGKDSFSFGYARVYLDHPDKKYLGFYHGVKPLWMIRDKALLERVLIKDFAHFHDRGIATDEQADFLDGNLFFLAGQKWRSLRMKLSPIFTTGKMKTMFPEMVSITNFLMEVLHREVKEKGEVEMKELMGNYTTDIIGSFGFGYEPAAIKDPNSDFRRIGRNIFGPTLRSRLVTVLRFAFPRIYLALRLRFWPSETYGFFLNLMKQTFKERLRTGVVRRDVVQLLLQLREKGFIETGQDEDEEEEYLNSSETEKASKAIVLNDQLLTAQAFVFFVAGFHTTSSSLAFIMYELARQPEIQEKARREVKELKEKHGSINFEAVKSMEYIEACFCESVRLHTPVGMLMRECAKDYELEEGVVIQKGDQVFISNQGIHLDPLIYPEPELFRPERFLGEGSMANREKALTFLPFGQGPRICIGKRFAVIEVKVTLAKILDIYRIEKGSTFEEPLKIDTKLLPTAPFGGIGIRLEKIKG